MSRRLGKYDSDLEAVLDYLAQGDRGFGDVDGYGYFIAYTNNVTLEDIYQAAEELEIEASDINSDLRRYEIRGQVHVISTTDSHGFCSVEVYSLKSFYEKRVEELEGEYDEFMEGRSEDGW